MVIPESFRRVICFLLVLCFLFCLVGRVKVQADPIAAGIMVAVGLTLAVGCIMVGLGVSPGVQSTDFWNLADNIGAKLPDKVKASFVAAEIGTETLLKAFFLHDTYYFHQEVTDFVNDYLFTGTKTYDESTGIVTSTAPVEATYEFPSSSVPSTYFDRALGFLYKNNSVAYESAVAANYRALINYEDGTFRYV